MNFSVFLSCCFVKYLVNQEHGTDTANDKNDDTVNQEHGTNSVNDKHDDTVNQEHGTDTLNVAAEVNRRLVELSGKRHLDKLKTAVREADSKKKMGDLD